MRLPSALLLVIYIWETLKLHANARVKANDFNVNVNIAVNWFCNRDLWFNVVDANLRYR